MKLPLGLLQGLFSLYPLLKKAVFGGGFFSSGFVAVRLWLRSGSFCVSGGVGLVGCYLLNKLKLEKRLLNDFSKYPPKKHKILPKLTHNCICVENSCQLITIKQVTTKVAHKRQY